MTNNRIPRSLFRPIVEYVPKDGQEILVCTNNECYIVNVSADVHPDYRYFNGDVYIVNPKLFCLLPEEFE